MKISTRIVAGYGVLILLSVAVLSYQVVVIRQLHDINRKLSEVNVRNALTSVDVKIHQGLVEEFVAKYYVSGDAQYDAEFRDAGLDLEADLRKLRGPNLPVAERDAIERVSEAWIGVQRAVREDRRPNASGEVPERVRNQLVRLSMESELVLSATESSIRDAALHSSETAAQAVSISRVAAAAALLLSILVSVPIVWSIASRLRELERATQIVAAGQFEHQMPVSGSDEFAALARDFNKMSRRLGELDQMKKDFVSHVSHDLKGPLASMRETVHLMMEGIPGPLNDKQRRLLGLCLKSSERLSGMIGNLLDVSKLEAGMVEYQFEACNLVPLVQSAVQEYEGLAHEKKLELVVEPAQPEVWARCDPGRLTQVVSNLVENAIKFSPEAGRIVARVEEAGAQCEVSVSDQGPGVPLASRRQVFDRFHQVSPGRKISGQGVGLGLAICKSIVEAHGGSIEVDGNAGGGSLFVVKIQSAEKVIA